MTYIDISYYIIYWAQGLEHRKSDDKMGALLISPGLGLEADKVTYNAVLSAFEILGILRVSPS